LVDHAFVKNPWGKDICDAKVTEGARTRTCCLPRREHGLSFYIASKIENGDAVARLSLALRQAGHIHTYDWSVHGPVFKPDATADQNIAAMRAVSRSEMDGVARADVVVVLLPGGRGTHVEVGAALAGGKLVVLCGEFQEELTGHGEYPWPCAFYYHPLAIRFAHGDEEARTEFVLRTLAERRRA
jgi:hypothetical protein